MLPSWLIGEVFGTFLLVLFGCGSVCVAVTTGALGTFQVAMIWGLGVLIAICVCGPLSQAHLNPSVTISLAAWGRFSWKRVAPYILAQVVGAFFAAAILYFLFGNAISSYEHANQIMRGQPGSEASAMVFGEFFPNPGGHPLTYQICARVSSLHAFAAEVIGTAVLLLVVFSVSDEKNKEGSQVLTAATIGLTVTLLISLLGPLTMACFNPARDIAPRIFSSLVGWNLVPFTANGFGWLTVYIIAPVLGGLLGGAIHTLLFKSPKSKPE